MTYVLAGKTVKELNADIAAGEITVEDAHALVLAKLDGNMRDGARARWTRVADMLAKGSLDVGQAFTNGNKPKAKAKTAAKPKAPAKRKTTAKAKPKAEALDFDAVAAYVTDQVGSDATAIAAFMTAFSKRIS
tara:strand:- start:186 stop:584 length:399 start_codon:yes stop_codon:yes gene_type:complete